MNAPKSCFKFNGNQGKVSSPRSFHHWFASLVLAGLSTVAIHAQPSWYNSGTQSGIQSGAADFYQHQLPENLVNGGYCMYFAFEDAMYYDANTLGLANLYQNNAADWVAGMDTNFLNIGTSAGANSGASTVGGIFSGQFQTYINNQGYASVGVTVAGNSGGGYAAFNNVTADLLAGSNALIFITNSAASTNQWWQFHVLDVVGFNQTNHTLDVLDPDNNKYGAFGFPGTNSSPPATGFYTNNFGVAVPYNLVPTIPTRRSPWSAAGVMWAAPPTVWFRPIPLTPTATSSMVFMRALPSTVSTPLAWCRNLPVWPWA